MDDLSQSPVVAALYPINVDNFLRKARFKTMNRSIGTEKLFSARNLFLAVLSGVVSFGIFWLINGFGFQAFIPAAGATAIVLAGPAIRNSRASTRQ